MTCPQSIAWWTPNGPIVAQQIGQRKGTSTSFFVVVVVICLVLVFCTQKDPCWWPQRPLPESPEETLLGDRVGSSSFKSIMLRLSFFQTSMEHTEIFALYQWEALKKNTVDKGVTFKKIIAAPNGVKHKFWSHNGSMKEAHDLFTGTECLKPFV